MRNKTFLQASCQLQRHNGVLKLLDTKKNVIQFRLNKNICRTISRVDIFIPPLANLISIRRSKNGMIIFNILKLLKIVKVCSGKKFRVLKEHKNELFGSGFFSSQIRPFRVGDLGTRPKVQKVYGFLLENRHFVFFSAVGLHHKKFKCA
jgi:hypothetical protein